VTDFVSLKLTLKTHWHQALPYVSGRVRDTGERVYISVLARACMYICTCVWMCTRMCLCIHVVHMYVFFPVATLQQQDCDNGQNPAMFSESNQSLISWNCINYFLNQKGPPLTYSFLNMIVNLKKNKIKRSPGLPEMNFELDTPRKIFNEYF